MHARTLATHTTMTSLSGKSLCGLTDLAVSACFPQVNGYDMQIAFLKPFNCDSLQGRFCMSFQPVYV